MKPEAIDMSKFMKNTKGHLVPIESVKAVDQARDHVVRDIVSGWKEIQELLIALKLKTMGEIQAFIDMSLEQYGTKIGGRKGNVSLINYDGTMKLQIAIQDKIDMTEEIYAALNLLYECAKDWEDKASPDLQVIINDILLVEKKGSINLTELFRLFRYNIEHPKWEPAMKAIRNSIVVVGSKSYVRAYERKPGGPWKAIPMDMAKL